MTGYSNLSFKKLNNIFAQTYEMDQYEGEKLRQKIKMEAVNEMDSIINSTPQYNKRFMQKRERPITTQKQREGSSDSTSDRSSSHAPVSGRKSAHIKNRIIRIKKHKKTKGLMNKLNMIRENIHKSKLSKSRAEVCNLIPNRENNMEAHTLSNKMIQQLTKSQKTKGEFSIASMLTLYRPPFTRTSFTYFS